MTAVRDVMTTEVTTATTTETIGPLRDLMTFGGLSAVPVLDTHGALAGIITSSDLVEEWPADRDVITVMTDRVATVAPDTTVATAARIMIGRRIHHLVVGDGATIEGIVSSWDLLGVLADPAD